MIGLPKQIITWLLEQDQTKDFECKRYHQKRSLDANAYCWVLCQKIADAVGKKKDDVYLDMIHDYAPSLLVPVEAKKEVKGFFKYYELFETSNIHGVPADYYKVWKGSSDMDSAEMAKFIDHIIDECHDLNIETMPPAEVQRIKEMWK